MILLELDILHIVLEKKIVVTLFILLALWTGKLRKYQIVRWSFWKAKIFERAHIYGYYQI